MPILLLHRGPLLTLWYGRVASPPPPCAPLQQMKESQTSVDNTRTGTPFYASELRCLCNINGSAPLAAAL